MAVAIVIVAVVPGMEAHPYHHYHRLDNGCRRRRCTIPDARPPTASRDTGTDPRPTISGPTSRDRTMTTTTTTVDVAIVVAVANVAVAIDVVEIARAAASCRAPGPNIVPGNLSAGATVEIGHSNSRLPRPRRLPRDIVPSCCRCCYYGYCHWPWATTTTRDIGIP